MRTHALLFILLVATSFLNAQIQVNSIGNIGLGTSATTTDKVKSNGTNYLDGYLGIGTPPNTSYRLNLAGDSYFNGTSNFVGNSNFSVGNMVIDGPGEEGYGCAFHLTAGNGYPGMFLSSSETFTCSYLLVVDGEAISTGSWTGSDLQLKKNIAALDGKTMLSKITNLNGKKYEFKNNEELEQMYKNITSKENEYVHKPMNLPKEERYGFIAQEIEKEFPELVKTDPKTNLKAVNYEGMIPILLESIKEQQKMISQIQDQIIAISAAPKLEALSPSSKNVITQLDYSQTVENALYQNAPNPFSQNTTIGYYLKENTQNAKIGIYDMNGTQLRCMNVSGLGKGAVVIDAKQLKAGIYMYSLIVDGSLVDTKRMVLTD